MAWRTGAPWTVGQQIGSNYDPTGNSMLAWNWWKGQKGSNNPRVRWPPGSDFTDGEWDLSPRFR